MGVPVPYSAVGVWIQVGHPWLTKMDSSHSISWTPAPRGPRLKVTVNLPRWKILGMSSFANIYGEALKESRLDRNKDGQQVQQ